MHMSDRPQSSLFNFSLEYFKMIYSRYLHCDSIQTEAETVEQFGQIPVLLSCIVLTFASSQEEVKRRMWKLTCFLLFSTFCSLYKLSDDFETVIKLKTIRNFFLMSHNRMQTVTSYLGFHIPLDENVYSVNFMTFLNQNR